MELRSSTTLLQDRFVNFHLLASGFPFSGVNLLTLCHPLLPLLWYSSNFSFYSAVIFSVFQLLLYRRKQSCLHLLIRCKHQLSPRAPGIVEGEEFVAGNTYCLGTSKERSRSGETAFCTMSQMNTQRKCARSSF